MSVTEKVETISTDFAEQNEPFDDVTFPEERFLDEISDRTGSLSMEERARLVSAFATFDYNRDANQLVDNLLELHDSHPAYFDPWHVNSEGVLEERFKEIGFRYPNRDAHAWAENCHILRAKYHGAWTELLLSVGADAPALVERLEDDDFLCIKGVKIAPMYARIINDEVVPLHNLWELEIPVDTWVRKISKEIFREDMSDNEIREKWRSIAMESGVDRHIVDGGIWQIGNKLDVWGEEYLKQLLEIEKFKYL